MSKIRVINQNFTVVHAPREGREMVDMLEWCARTCYQSYGKSEPGRLLRDIVRRGHHSVIEHLGATVRITTNRGVTHELVRHRLASFSQESTRYCNYGGQPITFIRPVWVGSEIVGEWDQDNLPDEHYFPTTSWIWLSGMFQAVEKYNDLLKKGWRPEQAREVLPNALKAEIVVTANLREWAHILTLRTSPASHPQMVDLMGGILTDFKVRFPIIFDGIDNEKAF